MSGRPKISAVPDATRPDGFFRSARIFELFSFDEKWGRRPLCGLDEAGRGPLAGPLTAAAVILDPETDLRFFEGLDDSKKMTPLLREKLYEIILDKALEVSLSIQSPQIVDRLNPLRASLAAMAEAAGRLKLKPALALADGLQTPSLECPAQAVVKGDGLSLSIAAASVAAKVTRDRLMEAEHLKYPQYGFDRHKGYGTREHLEALLRYGPCPIHRLTYRGVRPESQGRLF
ncbi:MAG: ribonuclease HII [Deltaproteobacteria bacterium]|jgi:ribonuclease HII|nr:ribonuclease HII [Deltaproteobacteria bacterium]